MTPEENELLTRIGPGTAMGDVLRRYWLPILESDALGPPDGPPRRVRLLGEDLVAFRATGGRVGLLAEACPHRRASLFFGRNEENGLRCVYHGWKFDADGRCAEMPTEPPESRLRLGLRAAGYPCLESNGLIWAYLGPRRDDPPPLPRFGWAEAPAERRATLTYQRACNWVQALEGDVDTAHLGWLHSRFGNGGERHVAFHDGDRLRNLATRDTQPVLEIADAAAGISIAARRDADGDRHYWRITRFLMPVFTSVPAIGEERRAKAWVPLDDAHTLVWEFVWRPDAAPAGRETRVPASGWREESEDPLSRGRFAAGPENDYGMDRDRQRGINFSGLEESPPLQDAAVQESMGPIVDRSGEHLGATDAGLVRVRQMLIDAARRLREGVEPPGVGDPDAYRLHGSQFVSARDTDWRSLAETVSADILPPRPGGSPRKRRRRPSCRP